MLCDQKCGVSDACVCLLVGDGLFISIVLSKDTKFDMKIGITNNPATVLTLPKKVGQKTWTYSLSTPPSIDTISRAWTMEI